MLASAFSGRSFGRAMGLMGPMMLPFTFVGPPLAGYIQDQTGSYQLAFQLGLAALVTAAALAFTLPRRLEAAGDTQPAA